MVNDLTGFDFNFLHVIEFDHIKETKSGKRKIWKCRCKCGKIVYLPTYKITSGETKSCGCIKNDMCHKAEKSNSPNSDTKGIYYENKTKKYRVLFYRNKKQYHLGRFNDFIDAKIMRLIADTFTSMDKNNTYGIKKETIK